MMKNNRAEVQKLENNSLQKSAFLKSYEESHFSLIPTSVSQKRDEIQAMIWKKKVSVSLL